MCSLGHSGHGDSLLFLGLELTLAELLLDDLFVIQLIFVLIAKIYFVSFFWLLHNIEVDFDPAPLHFLSVHLHEGTFRVGMAVETNVSETF